MYVDVAFGTSLGHRIPVRNRSKWTTSEDKSGCGTHLESAVGTLKNGVQRIHHKFQVDRSNIMNISTQDRGTRTSFLDFQMAQEERTIYPGKADTSWERFIPMHVASKGMREYTSETFRNAEVDLSCSKGISQTSQHKQQWSLNLRASRGAKGM